MMSSGGIARFARKPPRKESNEKAAHEGHSRAAQGGAPEESAAADAPWAPEENNNYDLMGFDSFDASMIGVNDGFGFEGLTGDALPGGMEGGAATTSKISDHTAGTTAAAAKTGGISLFQRRSAASSTKVPPNAPPVPPAVTPKPSNTLEKDFQASLNPTGASDSFELGSAPEQPSKATHKDGDLRQVLGNVAPTMTTTPNVATLDKFEGASLKTPFPKGSTAAFTTARVKFPAVTPGTNSKPAEPSMVSTSHKLLLATDKVTTTTDSSFLPQSEFERTTLAGAPNENVAPPEKDENGDSFDDMHQAFLDSLRDFDDYDKNFDDGLLEMDVVMNTGYAEMLDIESSLFDYIDEIDSSTKSARRGIRDCIEA